MRIMKYNTVFGSLIMTVIITNSSEAFHGIASTITRSNTIPISNSSSKCVPHKVVPMRGVACDAKTLCRIQSSLRNEEGDLAKKRLSSLRAWASKNFFVIGMVVAVALANIAPSLGQNGGILRPELFIGNYGVSLIFLISGLSLELSQFTQAMANLPLNMLIQAILFIAWPIGVGIPLTRVILRNVLPQPILDGILMTTCLPTTVNMCVILTAAANGNVAASLCNAVISNMAGIFATPALLFHFFGSSDKIQLPFWDMLLKLSQKVLLPVGIGQVLRFTFVKNVYQKNSKFFKRFQEVILLSILWNAFCTAVASKAGLELRHALALCLAILPMMHLAALASLFFSFSKFGFDRGDVVAAMFCASQKTLAFGLPLINTIFEGDPNLASYTAPIMFLHPIQLVIGSMLIPRLEVFTANVQKRN